MQDRERKLEGETNPRMKTEQGKNAEERRQEGKCEISGQNMCGKIEKRLHDEGIPTVHVAPNYRNIKSS